jgi:hypothetical protein
MSSILLTEQASTPATPSTDKVRLFINASGNLCSVDDAGNVIVYAAGLTNEQVQDIIGGTLTDTSSIDFTYNDAGDQISAAVLPAGVDHNSLANLTTGNPHTQYLLSSTAATTYQPLDGDLTAVASLTGTGIVARTAANTMATRTLTAGTGVSVANGDGVSGNPTISLPNVVTAGTYQAVTVDAQGRVTAGTNPTTLAGYGIVDAQPLDSDLTAIAALGSTGLIARTAAGTVATRTVTASTGITVTDGSGVAGNPTVAITNTGVTAGTYGSAASYPVITVNAQGQLTSVTTEAVPGGALFARTTGALTNSSNATYVNIPELSITLAASTIYRIRYILIGQSAAGGTGMTFSLNGGTVAPSSVAGYWETSISVTATNRLNFVNITTNSQFSAVAAANTNQLVNSDIILVTGGSGGTLVPQFRSETNGTQITIQANSFVIVEVLP